MLWANAASSATAQVTQCQLPTDIPAPRPVAPPRDEPRRIVPVAGYTLALSWSPQFCARAFGRSSEFQCSRRAAPFGFILHGLWPEGAGRDWPQYCHPAQLVPRDVIRANLCAMPSVQMIQHEWARHGTCSSDSPQRYFSTARTLFERLRLPDMAMLARRHQVRCLHQPRLVPIFYSRAFQPLVRIPGLFRSPATLPPGTKLQQLQQQMQMFKIGAGLWICRVRVKCWFTT